MNRGETRHGKLTGIGSGVASVDILLGVETGFYLDHIGRNVQNVGHHLRRGRFVALALRHRAHAHNDFAVNIEFCVGGLGLAGEGRIGVDDARLAEIVRAGIERGADAHADHSPLRARLLLLLFPLLPADQALSDVEHLRVVAGVIDAAVGGGVGHFAGANVIAQAHFIARNAELMRADVHHALEEPQMLHPRIAAIGPDRTLVAANLRHVEAHIPQAVCAGQNLRPDNAAERFVTRVGATIVHVAGFDGLDDAVFVERDARVEKCALIAVRARQHVLGACLGPLHGPPADFSGSQRAKRHVRIIGDLDAEAATDVYARHVDLINAHAKRRGKKLSGEGGKAVVCPEIDEAGPGVPGGDHHVVF